jgi:hypothetical protein
MTKQGRIILLACVLILSGAIGWYWWSARRIELYGGVKEFMRHLRKVHGKTAKELNTAGNSLPMDFIPMERLAQSSQDIYGVLANDPRSKMPAFVKSATELMRRATQLEQAWDDARPADAREAMEKLTEACNACHASVAEGRPPTIQWKLTREASNR